jgi:amino acid transporter
LGVALIAYLLTYAAAITLRDRAPALARPFRVPRGMIGMWLTAGVVFAGVRFNFVAAFFPSDQLPVGLRALCVGLVFSGTVLFGGIPLIIHHLRCPGWVSRAQPAE